MESVPLVDHFSTLPSEMMQRILKMLGMNANFVCIPRVCTAWRGEAEIILDSWHSANLLCVPKRSLPWKSGAWPKRWRRTENDDLEVYAENIARIMARLKSMQKLVLDLTWNAHDGETGERGEYQPLHPINISIFTRKCLTTLTSINITGCMTDSSVVEVAACFPNLEHFSWQVEHEGDGRHSSGETEGWTFGLQALLELKEACPNLKTIPLLDLDSWSMTWNPTHGADLDERTRRTLKLLSSWPSLERVELQACDSYYGHGDDFVRIMHDHVRAFSDSPGQFRGRLVLNVMDMDGDEADLEAYPGMVQEDDSDDGCPCFTLINTDRALMCVTHTPCL